MLETSSREKHPPVIVKKKQQLQKMRIVDCSKGKEHVQNAT
jgi:hypothetical protein